MRGDFMKRLISLLLCAGLIFLLVSCEGKLNALDITLKVSENFAFKYGAVYSDAYDEWNEFYLSPEMKTKILGINAEKYAYIKSVSGYFSRDMVSGSEFIAAELYDKSKRDEVMAIFYRRAAKKLDSDARVWCEGKFVFFICDSKAGTIIEFLKREVE
jgi:cupin superfamily acireductone dioxygenase involved in methionine salvage